MGDWTLLSKPPNGFFTQFELIEVDCDGSGAMIDLKKSALP